MTLLGTYKLTANTQSFSEDRYMHESLLQEGVVAAADYSVTPGGASLQWSAAAGMAWVQGDTSARQGLYPQVNDAAVTGLVAAGHATLPRIDQVILRVFDSSVTGASNTPTLSTLAGTATAGATLDNRTGAAALPATALRLADILVPAAASGVISAANIRDRRPWARGAFATANGSTAAPTTTSGSFTGIPEMTLVLECSGAPVVLQFTGTFSHSVAGGFINTQFAVDGTVTGATKGMHSATTNSNVTVANAVVVAVAAGRHNLSVQWATTGATATAVGTSRSFIVYESLRQNTPQLS